jgi:serine O-acetyltransferase
MKELMNFLIKNNFNQEIKIQEDLIQKAFDETVRDVQFHYPRVTEIHIQQSIICMHAELSIFLFRLGHQYFKKNDKSVINFLHGLMRTLCSCEFYFSNEVGEGFYPVHGLGSIIGSRCKIGKGFLIYHNCTIGHIADEEKGCTIGDYVTVFPGSMILGDVTIGNEVVVGANSVVFSDVASKSVCAGNPAKVIKGDSSSVIKKHRVNYTP